MASMALVLNCLISVSLTCMQLELFCRELKNSKLDNEKVSSTDILYAAKGVEDGLFMGDCVTTPLILRLCMSHTTHLHQHGRDPSVEWVDVGHPDTHQYGMIWQPSTTL